jgi:PIN domain nuclease of toxin-antitoxin system
MGQVELMPTEQLAGLFKLFASKGLECVLLNACYSEVQNEVYLSTISVWEAIVKYQLGKLPLPEHPATYLPKQRDLHQISSLNLDESSVTQLAKLPPIHRDPFDRMLICQALQNNLTIATIDATVRAYSVNVM